MGGAVINENIDPKSIQKNSSLSTIFTMINGMVGGTMLLLPTLTIQVGFFSSIFILIVSGFVSYVTCAIYTKHMKENELDIQYPIKRILGRKWYAFFVIVCSFYKYFLCMLYYVLIIQMLYSICCFFLELNGKQLGVDFVDPNDKDASFTLNMFSQQWIMLATFFPILAMLFMKNLNLLVKIAEIGVYAIYSYLIFIIFTFIQNLHEGTVHSGDQKIKPWGWNVGNLGGTAAQAFTIHTSFGNILKCNKNQKNNLRDLKFTYIGGCTVYVLIAALGSYGILNRQPQYAIADLPSKFTQFFGDKNWGPVIVEFLYFGHLISVLPVFFDISKRRALPLCYGDKEVPKSHNAIINVVFVCSCFVINCIPGITPSQITGFNGSMCCFFFVYMIPIIMHLVCYHGENKFLRKLQANVSRLTERNTAYNEEEDDEITNIEDEQQKGLKQKLVNNQYNSEQSGAEQESELHQIENKNHSKISCCSHKEKEERSLKFRLAFYGVIMFVGLCVLIQGIYNIVKGFMK